MATVERNSYVESFKKEEFFDLVIIWMSQGPLLCCGEIKAKTQTLVEIETFAEETISVQLTEKIVVLEDIDKDRFIQLRTHLRGLEISANA